MNEQEIKRRINACESQINEKYAKMKAAAERLGRESVNALSVQMQAEISGTSEKEWKDFIPLIIGGVIAIIFIIDDLWFLALIIFAIGFFITLVNRSDRNAKKDKAQKDRGERMNAVQDKMTLITDAIKTNGKI